jgi:hypothetical protein
MTSSKETSNNVKTSWRRAFPDGEQQPASNLIPFDRWLDSIGRTSATGWRYRRLGWISTLNISGRVYVTRDEIARFEERAARGEFSNTHVTPSRKEGEQ